MKKNRGGEVSPIQAIVPASNAQIRVLLLPLNGITPTQEEEGRGVFILLPQY
ncbi:MAG: hypothetical protein K5886_02735 [Lachnospiraceae bacterium]|nr:hypothetical protein [Lachnospiraceae bacterium]